MSLLAEKVKKIDIDSLDTSFSFSHLPAHDEIHIVSSALQEMTTNIHHQVAVLKQFITNISHEFKTPLMALQSTIDVGEKTKQHDMVLAQVRDEIGIMDRLLDTLTMLAQTDKKLKLEKKYINLDTTIAPLIREIQKKYPHIQFFYTGDSTIVIETNQ